MNEAHPSLAFERIRKKKHVRLHELVRRQITQAIVDARWAVGDTLPSETALAADFGVSVGTVRRALSELTAAGLLMRQRKTGTVVTGWSQLHNLSRFYHYFRLHDRQGELLHSRAVVIGCEHGPATEHEAQKLQLATPQSVIRIDRIRYIGNEAVMIDTFTLPSQLVPGFPDGGEIPELIYRFLLENYDIRIAAVREHITAELATPEQAALLKVEQPHAVLKFEEIAFDHRADPVLYAQHYATTSNLQYINEIR